MAAREPTFLERFNILINRRSPGWFLIPHDNRMQRGHNFGAERAVVISRGVEATSSELKPRRAKPYFPAAGRR